MYEFIENEMEGKLDFALSERIPEQLIPSTSALGRNQAFTGETLVPCVHGKIKFGEWEMVELVKCLPYKHEDPRPSP